MEMLTVRMLMWTSLGSIRGSESRVHMNGKRLGGAEDDEVVAMDDFVVGAVAK
jgi:hypothetical protein